MIPAPNAAKPGRLLSIDALRGFDMFWIIGGDELAGALAAVTGAPWAIGLKTQLEHVEWEGFRFYDLIFPLFMFLVGTVIPFSTAAAERRGVTRVGLWWHVIRRTAILFALGLLANGVLRLDWLIHRADGSWTIDINNHLRVTGVLQRIAISYGIAALIAIHTGPRVQTVLVTAILIGYWAVLAYVPNPETGVAGDLTKPNSLAGYIDRTYLPGRIMKAYYGFGDNEGLISTVPAVATVLMGVLAGTWLRTDGSPGRKLTGLFVAGGLCLAAGWGWSFTFPIIKNLWTSSFVLLTTGWSLLLLALFYGIIDVAGWRSWAFVFAVIGANAITIYIGQRFIDFNHLSKFFLSGAIRHSGVWGPVVAVAGAILAKWLFLLFLYRRGLFLRV